MLFARVLFVRVLFVRVLLPEVPFVPLVPEVPFALFVPFVPDVSLLLEPELSSSLFFHPSEIWAQHSVELLQSRLLLQVICPWTFIARKANRTLMRR